MSAEPKESAEPRTEAGKALLSFWESQRGISGRYTGGIDRDILAIEDQAATEARRELREWVDSRNATKWSPGWSEDFKRGYDAAVEEVESRL